MLFFLQNEVGNVTSDLGTQSERIELLRIAHKFDLKLLMTDNRFLRAGRFLTAERQEVLRAFDRRGDFAQ